MKFSPPTSITLCEVIIERYDATPGESEPVHLCNHWNISLFFLFFPSFLNIRTFLLAIDQSQNQ